MIYSPLLQRLIDSFCCLPSVGPKSAQRMALHLLERDREGASRLMASIAASLEKIGHCKCCQILSEREMCEICAHEARDSSIICVVENPVDVFAIEQATAFKGKYFVLMGHLSPLDGIGPEELGLDLLVRRLMDGEIKEVILATNPTVEGEATAHYISELAEKWAVSISRIAYGVPIGGELEYTDSGTLSHAFADRKTLQRS